MESWQGDMRIQDPCGYRDILSIRSLKVQRSVGVPRTLTKADLIEEVSGTLNLTAKESTVIVQSILGSMVTALLKGEKIEIRGFGSLS